MGLVRILMLVTAMIFFGAAGLHFGAVLDGYAHERARIPEIVIGIVLLAGALLAGMANQFGWWAATSALAFAILGTFVGLALIAIGIGPRTRVDLALHAAMLAMLFASLVLVWRTTGAA